MTYCDSTSTCVSKIKGIVHPRLKFHPFSPTHHVINGHLDVYMHDSYKNLFCANATEVYVMENTNVLNIDGVVTLAKCKTRWITHIIMLHVFKMQWQMSLFPSAEFSQTKRINKTLRPASIITPWFKSHSKTNSNPATVENGNPVEVFCLSTNTFSSVFLCGVL